MSSEPSRKSPTRQEHNRIQSQLFDRMAEFFQRPIPQDVRERLVRIVAQAEVKPRDAVLDVGTGTGVLLPLILAAQPSRVVACDLSQQMLSHAVARFGAQVILYQGDVVDLPAELGPFDTVFCNAVFPNFYDRRQTLEVIHSLLKAGGKLIISHPMGKDFVRQLKANSRELELEELPEREPLMQLLKEVGFQLVHFIDERDLYLAIAQKP